MYRISQFKPALYILLLVGILGFALASESAGVWVLGTGGILLNAWLVKTGRFIPTPRLLANVVTIAAMLSHQMGLQLGVGSENNTTTFWLSCPMA